MNTEGPPRICAEEDCERVPVTRGLCDPHYRRALDTGALKRRSGSLQERFDALVVRTEGCWIWTRTMPNGRARTISVGGKPTYAYRVAYELYVGPIPDGHEIDHLCRNTACVRPDHLEPVTPAENRRRNLETVRDKIAATRVPSGRCQRGHERRRSVSGRWYCPTCEGVNRRAYLQRKREASK